MILGAFDLPVCLWP